MFKVKQNNCNRIISESSAARKHYSGLPYCLRLHGLCKTNYGTTTNSSGFWITNVQNTNLHCSEKSSFQIGNIF